MTTNETIKRCISVRRLEVTLLVKGLLLRAKCIAHTSQIYASKKLTNDCKAGTLGLLTKLSKRWGVNVNVLFCTNYSQSLLTGFYGPYVMTPQSHRTMGWLRAC